MELKKHLLLPFLAMSLAVSCSEKEGSENEGSDSWGDNIPEGNTEVTISADRKSVYLNPLSGWVIYVPLIDDVDRFWREYENFPSSEGTVNVFDYGNIIYLRGSWTDFNPEEGVYIWQDGIDETKYPLARSLRLFEEGAKERGLKLAFTLKCDSRDANAQCTPPFVKEKMDEKYGADAVRFYMLTNSSPWDNLKFDTNGVDEVRRKFFGTLYNTYSFFSLYANVDGFDCSQYVIPVSERPEIDRWILSELNSLIKGVDAALADYEPTKAGRLIDAFVCDDLSNRYVRLNRKRFWGKEMDDDKLAAYETLYTCLETVAKLLAPFAPFYSDQLYMDLTRATGRAEAESVHLAKFPVADESLIDADLEARMRMAQKLTTMVLALRRKVNIKVRQPLQCMMIPAVDDAQRRYIEDVKKLVMTEVNVKELKFVEGSGVLVKKVKCNFRTMGKKYGKLMKGIAAQMSALDQDGILAFEQAGELKLDVDGQSVTVNIDDVEIINEDIPGWLVANDGNLTVALEVELTDDLRNEGMARELINRIQNLRKDCGLEITDRVNVTISPDSRVEAAVGSFADYIKGQVLADNITVADNDGEEVALDETPVKIKVEKV